MSVQDQMPGDYTFPVTTLSPPSMPDAQKNAFGLGHGIALAGAALAFIAAFLPWQQLTIQFGALFHTSLTDTAWQQWAGVAAAFCVLFGLALLLLVIFWPHPVGEYLPPAGIIALLFGLTALVGMLIDSISTRTAWSQMSGGVSDSLMYGFYLALGGAALMTASGIMLLLQSVLKTPDR